MQDKENNIISKTYKESCDEWYKQFTEKSGNSGAIPSPILAYAFAEWLDKFNGGLTSQLAVIAMIQARKIDNQMRELLIAELIKFDPAAPARIAKQITGKHIHSKKTQIDVHNDIDEIVKNPPEAV